MELHSNFIAFGLDPSDFWHLTPREIVARMLGAHRRQKVEHDNRAWLAWTTAALTRAKVLPELKTLLSDFEIKPQTPQQQTTNLDTLFLAMGGDPDELRKRQQKRLD